MLACLALSLLFFAHEAKAEALGLNTVKTAVINQVRKDDSVARTLQEAISYKSPSWEKVLQPQLAQREEQIRVENERRAQEAKAQAEAEAARQAAVAASVLAKPAPVVMTDAKMFIYMRESGNNPGSVNRYSGACGLGQALPCSKMPCSLSDYACQDQFFTGYMLARYGSWENAVAFWLAHSWW